MFTYLPHLAGHPAPACTVRPALLAVVGTAFQVSSSLRKAAGNGEACSKERTWALSCHRWGLQREVGEGWGLTQLDVTCWPHAHVLI